MDLTAMRGYDPPKPSLERLLKREPEAPGASSSDETQRNLIQQVTELARDRLIIPALQLSTPDEYIEFWTENSSQFSGFLRTLGGLIRAAEVISGRTVPPDLRLDAFASECIRASDQLSEMTSVRSAIADLRASTHLVGRFPSRSVLPNSQDDQDNAARYNSACELLDALLVCVYESASVEVSPGIREAVVTLPAEVADLMYRAAVTGANLRGIEPECDFALVAAIWPDPSEEMLSYLEKRMPELVNDDLRSFVRGHQAMDRLISRIEADVGEPRPEPQSSQSAEEIEKWALAVAEDLSQQEWRRVRVRAGVRCPVAARRGGG